MASNESINFGNIGPDTSSIIKPKIILVTLIV